MESNLMSYLLGLATLFFGWILGIFSNVINSKLKRATTKKDIKIGLISELKELQIYLSSVCLLSTSAANNFDKDFVSWLRPYLLTIFESVEFEVPENLKSVLPEIMELDDDNLFQLLSTTFVKEDNGGNPTSLTYQTITTPYTDLKISDISLFSTTIQKALFTLKRDIGFLNRDINQVWFYHSKTFDNPTDNNFKIIQFNLSALNVKISKWSKTMVDKIEKTISDLL